MKILLCSYRFAPDIGGVETVGAILAEQFARLGHEVRVVTGSAGNGAESAGEYKIIRSPSGRDLVGLVRWSDVVLHNQFSMRFIGPGLVVRRPLFIVHQTFPSQDPNPVRRSLKLHVCRLGTNLCTSDALQRDLAMRSNRLRNPVRVDLFRSAACRSKQRDFIFVGRLIPDKRVDCLLRALALLAQRKAVRTTTIVGDGPEREKLQKLASGLPVNFVVGLQTDKPFAELVATHRYLVLPSDRNETFGLVVLEGIAAGCVVIGSDHGGIPEAVGPCGALFPAGDVGALAELLINPPMIADFERVAVEHLAPFHPRKVAQEYLQLFEQALQSSAPLHC
jgi:glycogen(starch) synthase